MDKLFAILTPSRLLLLIGIVAILIMGYEVLRRKHRLRVMLLGSGSGIAALVLLHCWGDAIGLYLPLTLLHMGVAGVMGIPGVLLIAAIEYFL